MMKNQSKIFLIRLKTCKIALFLFLLGVLNAFNTHGQIKTISGVVTDELNTPLSGVTVVETGTINGVATDFNGKYFIKIKEGVSLSFSYIGYKTVTKIVGRENTLNVKLDPDIENLDETIVIGYGSVKKKDLTGSVSIVDMEKITKAPVVNFDQALAGRVAGVQVSGGSGEPGSGMNIVIRGGNTVGGNNSPLYVVDGFIVESFSPGLVNPSDIQSISVLKDASATAIYGVRGANGVIIITTKRAKSGQAKITYEARLDYKEVIKTLPVLGTHEFLKLQLEINNFNARTRYFSVYDEKLGYYVAVGDIEDYKNVKGRNWQEEAFRIAHTKTHKLNISRGSDKTKFNASLNAVEDQGTLLNSEYLRLNGRLTSDHKINDKLNARIDISYTSSVQEGINVKGSSSYSFLRNLITYNPIANIFVDYPEGFNPLDDVSDEFDLTNIVVWHPIVTLNNEHRKIKIDHFVMNLGLKYGIKPNLTLETKASFNKQFRGIESFNNSKTVYGRLINKGAGINGSINNQKWSNINSVNTLTYKNYFNDHSINVLLGTTFHFGKSSRIRMSSADIPRYLEGLGMNSFDGGVLNSATDLVESYDSKTFSFLGRVNYAYKDNYIFTGSLRRDASHKFSSKNRVGYFPSAAVSWNAHKENFIKNLDIFSQLKFKTSYGKTGNDRIPATARFDFLTGNNASYVFNNKIIRGQIPTKKGSNPNLFWETTEQLNAGLNAGFLNGRISLEVEAYQKDTKDLLIDADAALSQGFSKIWVNSGHVRNRGLEIGLRTTNIYTKNFKWTTNFNISFNQNTVESLPEDKPIFGKPYYYHVFSKNQFIVEEGKPLGNMFGYISDGVYQISDFENYNPKASTHTLKFGQPSYREKGHQPGDEKYKDLSGDRKITPMDKTIIGNGLPVHFGGFNNTVKYKNIELSVFFQWSYGSDVLNANRLVFESMIGGNQLATTLNRWTPTNQNTTMHRAKGQGFKDISSRIVEDGSYLRLKTVNLSYNFSKDVSDKLNLSKFHLYFAAQNLFTWTDYSGFDPDVSVLGSPIMPSVDYSSYPIHKILSLGINISF